MAEGKVIYEILRNADTTEGRGPMVHFALAADLETADKIAERVPKIMGVGRAHHIVERFVFETLFDFDEYNEGAVREAALNKLTALEKRALGLSK